MQYLHGKNFITGNKMTKNNFDNIYIMCCFCYGDVFLLYLHLPLQSSCMCTRVSGTTGMTTASTWMCARLWRRLVCLSCTDVVASSRTTKNQHSEPFILPWRRYVTSLVSQFTPFVICIYFIITLLIHFSSVALACCGHWILHSWWLCHKMDYITSNQF